MATIKSDFGAGGVGLQPGHGSPDLATALRDVADDIGDLAGAATDWVTGVAVAANVATLSRAGAPISVEATAGGSAGAKTIVNSAPGAGEVQVAFTDGVATLTFAGADAVTECAVLLSPAPASIRTLKG